MNEIQEQIDALKEHLVTVEASIAEDEVDRAEHYTSIKELEAELSLDQLQVELKKLEKGIAKNQRRCATLEEAIAKLESIE